MRQRWQDDWAAFVHQVAELMDCGYDEVALTRFFQNKPIQWIGTIHDKSLNDRLPGIQFTMPMVHAPLKNGKYIRAGFAFVSFKKGDSDLWRGFEKGAITRFETEIGPGKAPFYGVRCDDLGDFYTLKIRLEGARPT